MPRPRASGFHGFEGLAAAIWPLDPWATTQPAVLGGDILGAFQCVRLADRYPTTTKDLVYPFGLESSHVGTYRTSPRNGFEKSGRRSMVRASPGVVGWEWVTLQRRTMAPYPTDAAGHRHCADAPARDRAKRRGCGRGPAGRVGCHGGEGSVSGRGGGGPQGLVRSSVGFANLRPMTKSENPKSTFVRAFARYLFLQAWADRNDRNAEDGKRHVRVSGRRIEDVAPKSTPAEFTQKAKELTIKLEVMNKVPLEAILAKAGGGRVAGSVARDFGAAMAMMVTGTGVSWFDDHPEFPLKYPHTEVYL